MRADGSPLDWLAVSRADRGGPPRERRVPRWLLLWGSAIPLAAVLIGAGVLALTYAFAAIPLPKDVKITASAQVFDRHGKLIGTYSNGEERFLIDTRALPRYVWEAVVAAEDRNFFHEGGISLRGTLRAAWADLRGGGITQGGSTLTQQYVKNAILNDPSRTFTRKVKEAILAIKLDHRYSKRRILGFYLNTIYLGRGAYGIEAAARSYFGEHAKDLSLAQAAYLAGIIPAPEAYQPQDHPKLAEQRRDLVLREMHQQGYITKHQMRRASRGPVHALPDTSVGAASEKAAYFMEWLRKDYLYPKFHDCLYTCGLKIYTTLDLSMQREAERAVASTLTEPSDPPAALVSLTPDGQVRAMVGGPHFHSVRAARGFNYATDLPGRQAGSSFKPFTLLTAIEQGISPLSTFSGASPTTITNPVCDNADGTPWQVSNYADEQFGYINLDQATTDSVNTVYAQLAAELGPDKIKATLERFGFDRRGTPARRDIPAVCSLALGILDVTPLEQARAYAALDNDGKLPDVRPIAYIKNRHGDCVVTYVKLKGMSCQRRVRTAPARAAPADATREVTQILTHVVQGGTATAANIGRPVAGKTGTTTDNRDAWFAGYVPQLVTVVWMGYPNYKGHTVYMHACGDPHTCRVVHGYYSGVTGGTLPAMMWARYMSQATAGMPVESFPLPGYLPLHRIGTIPTPTATPTPVPSSTPTPSAIPTATSSPSPSPTAPSPSGSPRPSHSPPGGGGRGRGGSGGGGRGGGNG